MYLEHPSVPLKTLLIWLSEHLGRTNGGHFCDDVSLAGSGTERNILKYFLSIKNISEQTTSELLAAFFSGRFNRHKANRANGVFIWALFLRAND